VKYKHTAAHEENPILSNTKIKFIDLVLHPHPQNCLLYYVYMQTCSSFKKRIENYRISEDVQFSSVQSLSRVRLCDPMNHSTPGLPVHHQLPEFTQTHVHRVGDAIQPSHPLSSPSHLSLSVFISHLCPSIRSSISICRVNGDYSDGNIGISLLHFTKRITGTKGIRTRKWKWLELNPSFLSPSNQRRCSKLTWLLILWCLSGVS